MKKIKILLSLMFVFLFINSNAQMSDLKVVKWTFAVEDQGHHTFKLIFKAQIKTHWHLYSQHIKDGGPIPTAFKFEKQEGVKFKGVVEEESKVIEQFDKTFNMDLKFFSNEAIFTQTVKVKKGIKEIKGAIEFMVCDDEQCLPPSLHNFVFKLK